jgi:hypothetical protein
MPPNSCSGPPPEPSSSSLPTVPAPALPLTVPALPAPLAAQSLVHALAFLGINDSLGGLFTHAVLATTLAIIVVVILGRAAAHVGAEAKISREVD